MKTPPVSAADTERLLTFEVAGAVYALPIAEVHEVAETDRICCVPTIPQDLVGVMNWHGDALPVVAASLLFDGLEIEDLAAPDPCDDDGDTETRERAQPTPVSAGLASAHVLVVSGRDDEPARLGLPIDRVLGLVDGLRRRREGRRLVVERRPVDGRVVNVLDPRRLVLRATEVIARRVD